MANSVDPDQTALIGTVCSGSTLFASILNSSVMLGNYLQQTTSADDIFRCIFFLGTLRVRCKFGLISYSLSKTYVVGTQKNLLIETVLFSTVDHQIREIIQKYAFYHCVLCHVRLE